MKLHYSISNLKIPDSSCNSNQFKKNKKHRRFKLLTTTIGFIAMGMWLTAQEIQTDSLEGEKITLDEVFVSAIRVTKESPVTFSNLTKAQLKPRNLGQDIPVLLNFMPAVVTTSDAGAGVGYTGIRVRGSDATRVNVTINGIPYNDSEVPWHLLGKYARFCLFVQKACNCSVVLEHQRMALGLLGQVLILLQTVCPKRLMDESPLQLVVTIHYEIT